MTVAYRIGKSLYLNITNKCPCACTFCLRSNGPGIGGSGSLWLEREPTADEIRESIRSHFSSDLREMVFCGYGEPTERLDTLLETADWIKRTWPGMPVRVNTNGLSDLIAGRPTAELFKGKVDTLSISVNTDDPAEYLAICRPKFGEKAYPALLAFAESAAKCVPAVVMTVVGEPVTPKDKQERISKICARIGARLRVRPFEPPTRKRDSAFAVAPYATWMAMMFLLPHTALSYAVRSAAAGAVLCACLFALFKSGGTKPRVPRAGAWALGIVCGLAVAAMWILPEYSAFYRRFMIIGDPSAAGPSPYDPAVCGWGLFAARLLGSGIVIAAAEELFFRHFLYRRLQRTDWRSGAAMRFDLQAFLWSVGLFALEHDRIAAAAAAGAAYTLVYIRRGFFAAFLAHAVTNLVLGAYVVATGMWRFW